MGGMLDFKGSLAQASPLVRGESFMALAFRHIRTSLVALVAIVAASFAAADASACSTMKQGNWACPTVCGCCSTETNEAPATGADMTERATTPEAPASCRTAPGGGCSCRLEDPAAPARKPTRSTVQRQHERGHSSDFVLLGEAYAARTTLTPQVPATQSPPKAPLYLQNERLLF
jgi:hypothetical protein